MPLFEYQCEECLNIEEVLQHWVGERLFPDLTKCTKCGGNVKRRLSMGSFILTGEGFHNTDYPVIKKQSK